MKYTADHIITESLLMIRDFEKSRVLEGAMYFAQAYRDLQLYHSLALKQVWVQPSAIKTIPFPEDFMGFTSVSIPYRGQLFSFTEVQNMLPTIKDKVGEVESPDESEHYYFKGSERRWDNCAGYVWVDESNRRLQLKDGANAMLQETPHQEVLLTYKSEDLSDLSSCVVGLEYVNLLTACVAYKLTLSTPESFPRGMVSLRKQEYMEEVAKYHENLNCVTIDELVDVVMGYREMKG